MIKAVYTGTFDPVTNGHLVIIERASKMYDVLYVTIFINPHKTCLFSVEERIEMLREATKQFPNVVIDESSALAVEYAREVGAQVLVRGLRATEDYNYESLMCFTNQYLDDALNKLVKNLNQFNKTFSSNTQELGGTLSKVNESYKVQADIIQAVHDMDVMKMAKANVNVLKELQGCTEKLEDFQYYLNSVKGYTTAIEKFNEQFFAESDRLHVLEEIRDFFTRNKAEIAKNLTDETDALKTALKTLQNTSVTNMAELEKVLTDEVDTFKTINKQLLDQFTSQLEAFPKINKNLEAISQIPSALTTLASKIEKNNSIAIEKINKKVERIEFLATTTPDGSRKEASFPVWGKLLLVMCAIMFFVSSLFMGYCSYRIMSDTSVIRNANSVDEEMVDSVSDSLSYVVKQEPVDTVAQLKQNLVNDRNRKAQDRVRRAYRQLWQVCRRAS